MKKLLSALFVLALCSSVAMASVPDPSNCEVTPDQNNGVMVCPDGNFPTPLPASVITVTVRNSANNPIEGAIVEVDFHSNIEICTSFENGVLTNASGVAQLTLAAAGCVHNVPNAAVVRANGIIIRTFNFVKSPANGSATDNAPLNTVGTAALVAFGGAFNGVTTNPICMDLDNDGAVAVSDLVPFGVAYNRAYSCTLDN